MALEAARNATQSLLAKLPLDEGNIVEMGKAWFEEYKKWERDETFERALQDRRMTARLAKLTGKPVKFDTYGTDGKKTHKIVLDNTVMGGLKQSVVPTNFTDKKKNELGLHDLSAVLLKPGVSITGQGFSKSGVIVFMPLPLEEDLRLVHDLGIAAKVTKVGPLYELYIDVRSRMTRIKYGSPEDMSSGFYVEDKGDGKDHVRYGTANILGGLFAEKYLKERAANALTYKKSIAEIATKGGNNEVTVKYRQHGGIFPLIGTPKAQFPERVLKQLSFEFLDGEMLLADFDKPLGKITDLGVFTPVAL